MKIGHILAISSGFLFSYFSATATAQENLWPCDVPGFKHLIGEPSSVIFELDLPENVRHVPGDRIPFRTDASRLTIMHSGTLEDAKTDPNSTIVGFICG
ncbi:hypothetical protein [Antarctobacter jejuensis]|uniref:hypothetical protein n=1 Tax=Antarctobacter jejuensis TaxID=1439938 RepID=UPI003FD36809